MDIQAGNFLKRVKKYTSIDKDGIEQTKERKEYYFILDVDGNDVEIMEFRMKNTSYYSSPYLDADVYEYDDISQQYNITVVPIREVTDEQIYESYKHYGLNCKRNIGCIRRWHGKEMYIQYDRRFYNGKEFVYPPAGM